jgi:hypothetical protein
MLMEGGAPSPPFVHFRAAGKIHDGGETEHRPKLDN